MIADDQQYRTTKTQIEGLDRTLRAIVALGQEVAAYEIGKGG